MGEGWRYYYKDQLINIKNYITTNTHLAPNATALKISLPLLAPPSTYISHLPLTAFAISSNTSIGARQLSNYLAP